ncbi:hypothetical protein ACR6C2_08460 [Streptomyces sp. INA 01156]
MRSAHGAHCSPVWMLSPSSHAGSGQYGVGRNSSSTTPSGFLMPPS